MTITYESHDNRLTLTPKTVYELSYSTRDLGYGISEGYVDAYWTGDIDAWGKLTIQPVNGGPTLYLFPDEIIEAL